MGDFVRHEDMALEPTAKVLKKDVYAKYIEAEDLLSTASDEAKKVQKLSLIKYEKQKRYGRTAGLEEAKVERDKKLIDLSNKAIENLRDIESAVIDVVSSCVRAIIGEIDSEHLIAKIVAKKMADLKQTKSLVITVNPINDTHAIHDYLANHLGVEDFALKHNKSLQADQVVIDAALGSINTTIEREVLMVIDEVEESCLQLGRAVG